MTHDARTIRYPDPMIKVNDTIRIDLDTGKITDFIKFETGWSAHHFKVEYVLLLGLSCTSLVLFFLFVNRQHVHGDRRC